MADMRIVHVLVVTDPGVPADVGADDEASTRPHTARYEFDNESDAWLAATVAESNGFIVTPTRVRRREVAV